MTKRNYDVLSYIDNAMMVLAGIILIVMMLHMCLGALFRAAGVSINIQTLTIVSAWYMISVTFLSMPYMNRVDGCMSVDIFAHFIKGRARSLKNIAISILCVFYLGIMAYLTFWDALEMSVSGEIRETATGYLTVWPPRWVLPAVFLVMTLRAAFKIVSRKRALTKGEAGG